MRGLFKIMPIILHLLWYTKSELKYSAENNIYKKKQVWTIQHKNIHCRENIECYIMYILHNVVFCSLQVNSNMIISSSSIIAIIIIVSIVIIFTNNYCYPLPGDASLLNLGMSNEDYLHLSFEVTSCYYNLSN